MRKTSLVSLIAAILLLVSWLQPLHILPWVSWHSEFLAFAATYGVVLASLVVGLCRKTTVPPQLPLAALLWPGLGIWVLLQWCATDQIGFGGDALVIALYFMLCAMAWSVGHVAASTASRSEYQTGNLLELLAWTVLCGAFISAWLAFVQAWDVWGELSWINRMPQLRRPGANLGQPNQLATLLVMGVASLLFLYEQRRLGRLVAISLLLPMLVGLAATESRTGLLSMAGLTVLCLIGQRLKNFQIRSWEIVSVFAVSFAAYAIWPLTLGMTDIQGSNARVDLQPGMRLIVWPQLFEAVSLRPWMGWGLREVSTAHNAVASEYLRSEPYTYAHNLILDIAIGVGLPLTLLLLALTGVWLWRRIRMTKDTHAGYCVAVILPVAIHSMLEFPFAYAYFLAPTMFVLGYWGGLTGGAEIKINYRVVVPLVLTCASLSAWTAKEYVEIEEDFRVVRFESMRIGKTPAEHRPPHIIWLTQLKGLLDAGRLVPTSGMEPAAIELARKAALRFPWPATQNRYALALALNGENTEAIRQLRVIRAQHGEKTYAEIRSNWQALAEDKHPVLRELDLP